MSNSQSLNVHKLQRGPIRRGNGGNALCLSLRPYLVPLSSPRPLNLWFILPGRSDTSKESPRRGDIPEPREKLLNKRATLPNMRCPPKKNPRRGDLPEPRERSFNMTPCTSPDPFCLSAGLAQSLLALISALASGIWQAILTFFSHERTLHLLTECFFSCIHPSKGASTSSLPSRRYGSLSTLSGRAHCH